MADPTIVILTRERAAIGTTWNLFPQAILVLNRAEEEAYRAAGHAGPMWLHDETTSVGVRNHVLERVPEGTELVMLDDDIKALGRFTVRGPGKYAATKMDGAAFLAELFKGFEMARQSRRHLFGVAPTTNPLHFNPQKQVRTDVFVNGPMMCIRTTKHRFDPMLRVKCDYDFTAQHIASGAGVFRLDYLWQNNDFDTLPGGRSCYKDPRDKAESCDYLLAKWPEYFRPNPKREHELIMSAAGPTRCK